MNKRGEITSFQLALLIFALLGLVVLTLFLISINKDTYSSDEICKISVLSRATLEKAVPSTGSAVPLKCTTKKICITTKASVGCNQFNGEDKSTISTIVLPSDETEAIHLIEQTSAESMYNCWELMGEGKLDIFNNVEVALGLNSQKPTCVICSRIAVANTVPKELINKVNVNSYLKNNYIPGTSLTYIQAFSDQATKTFGVIENENIAQLQNGTLNGLNKAYGNTGQENITINGVVYPVNREMAYLFMQIKSPSIGEVWKNQLAIGSTVAGGAFVASQAPGISVLWSLLPAKATVVGSLAIVATVAGFGAYNSYQGQQVAAGYCGQFVSKDEKGNQGCSLVEGVNYNVDDINALCDTIQGNP